MNMSGTETRIGRQVLFALQLLAVLAATAGEHLVQGLDHENMLCANDNTPICARSRGEYLLFKNECDLRKAQRENLIGGPLADVALFNCLPNCDFECHDGFQPICGVSVTSGLRKSFRNRCEMVRNSCFSKSDWVVYKWGVCPTGRSQPKQSAHTVLVGQRKRARPLPCTNVYRPVCASYAGVKSTFSNECLVNAENMRTRRNWRVVSEGLCGEDSTKMKHNRKYKPKSKPKVDTERSKRSHKQLNQLDDFEISEDAVQIFAPSTFHTQFISNSGTMEKSYSLPARKPYIAALPKGRGAQQQQVLQDDEPQEQTKRQATTTRSCVFSNEPVCGSFNGESRTFANVCALMDYSQAVGNAWTILYEGTCRRCDTPCPTQYSPICANRNGIGYTIINECYLERVRCKDPNSDWKITHKGECALLNDEVAQSIPKPKPSQKPLSLIPQMLYAANQLSSSSSSAPLLTTPRPRTRTPLPTRTTPAAAAVAAPAVPRRKFRKLKRPTPTPKDLSNRKIRKTELLETADLDPRVSHFAVNPYEVPAATGKLWATKDNWLVRQTIDNVKNRFNKKPSPKKAYAEKYPHYYWPMTPTTPAPLMATTVAPTTTTSTADPLNTLDGLSIAELLNFEVKAQGEIADEVEAGTEILFMVSSTTKEPRTSGTEATTPTTTSLATTPRPTEASTESTPPPTTTNAPHLTSEVTTTTTSWSDSWDSTTHSTTKKDLEESADGASTFKDKGTTETLDWRTTDTSEPTPSATGETTTGDAMSSTANLDYMADAPLASQSEQTSIYGLDKNSLIMRLLRARSNKNTVL